MGGFHFERDCRTPNSEAYTIVDDETPVGRVDLHFTNSVVHATLCVSESLTAEAIQDLIEVIDDSLVDVVGVAREEFIVHVFQGREAGVFSDHDFGEDGNHEEGG